MTDKMVTAPGRPSASPDRAGGDAGVEDGRLDGLVVTPVTP